MTATEEAYISHSDAGRSAYLNGMKLSDNPHQADSDIAAWWAMGWQEADNDILRQADQPTVLPGYIDDHHQQALLNG